MPAGTAEERCGRGGADTEDDAVYMRVTDPFVRRQVAYAAPPRQPIGTLGNASGCRAEVARSYVTPGRGWQTIWRTLANPGE